VTGAVESPAVTGGIVVACACGEVYELRPEYAGRLVECSVCRRHLRVGSPPPAGAGDPAFDRDLFLLRERLLTITSKYEVQGADGTPVLYVERPTYPFRTIGAYVAGIVTASLSLVWLTAIVRTLRLDLGGALIVLAGLAPATFLVVSMSLRPLRHVTVYRDESRREILLRVRQDQRWAVLTRTYTVMTAAGETLARLRKRYVHNLIRKRWYVEAPDGHVVGLAIEESIVLSLLRRVLGSLFGLLRTNFVLIRTDGTVLGEFNRKFTILDRYVLDLTADPARELDRRVALVLGIMLDTGEGR
jgi:uncharacterized protein YxjI